MMTTSLQPLSKQHIHIISFLALF